MQLPIPLVGGLCFSSRFQPLIKDECLDMIKGVIEISQPKNILEFGTHCGSSSLLFLALSNSNVISVDLCDGKTGHIEMDYSYFDYFVPGNHPGINLVIRTFNRVFPGRFKFIAGDSTSQKVFDQIKDTKFELHFIDGGHSYDCAHADALTCVKLGIKYALVDDYTTSEDIRRACEIPEFELVKIYENVHNVASVGCALFLNKNV